MENIKQIVEKRISSRKFTGEDLSVSEIKEINKIINRKIKTPFGSNFVFKLIDKNDFHKNKKIKLGTYGFISNGRYFIVGKSPSEMEAFVDYGYALERVVLDITALSLGSCWLGGTFNRKKFNETVKLKDGEVIPSVIVTGRAYQKRSIREKITRASVKADQRKDFKELFFEGNFETPFDPGSRKIKEALNMLRLAPSAENGQPWRVLSENNKFFFYLKRKKIIDMVIKKVDLHMVDMGIAMSHFELTLNENGIKGFWKKETNHCKQENLEYIASWVMNNDKIFQN